MSNAADRAGRWVYRGVWGVLVGWLRVPDEAPNVPPGSGDVVRSLRPAPGFLSYLKIGFWVLAVIFDVVIIGIWVLILAANPIAGAITAPVFWGLAIIPDIFAYVALHVRFDTTWYVVTERAVRIRRGVWIITENTITFENVQNVSVRQGPLQRHFGIANVLVQTAGGGGSAAEGGTSAGHQGLLEGVDDAQTLRTLIMQRAEASRHTGLGDEHHEALASFGPTHVAVLREIRDTLTT